MAEYIERTEELILAVNAGARAIENTKRYHGASYVSDVFSDNYKEIPYLKAAEVLRGFDEIPVADVVPVVHCKDCRHMLKEQYGRYCQIWGMYNGEGDEGFCNHGERKEGTE